MAITAQRLLDVARSQIGYVEAPGNNTKFGQWYGLNGAPWCAMFVSWVFAAAGAPLHVTTTRGFAYCPYGVAYFQKRGAWLPANATPRPGDVVFFQFGSRVNHVGLVESARGPYDITTIEGNTDVAGGRTGGRVMRKNRRGGIVGYGRPDLAAARPSSGGQVPTHPTIRRGSRGAAVSQWQSELNANAGQRLKVDGDFGPATEDATKNFQRFFKLAADGVVGPKTWGVMDYVKATRR